MSMNTKSCKTFVETLASDSPVPGGGGAAALVGAIGIALGHMVGSLMANKNLYSGTEAEFATLMSQCKALLQELLDLVQADENGFLPLIHAYSIPKDHPYREIALEKNKALACKAPLKIMELCCKSLDYLAIFAQESGRFTISDVGCGAVCCKAALRAASLNVFANTRTMKNRSLAEELENSANKMLADYVPFAEQIFGTVEKKMLQY